MKNHRAYKVDGSYYLTVLCGLVLIKNLGMCVSVIVDLWDAAAGFFVARG